MNDQNQTPIEDLPENLKGVIWAQGIGIVIAAFVMLTWLGVQRAELVFARNSRREAENEISATRTELNETIQSLNQQLSQARSAQFTTQNQMQVALQAKAQAESAYAQEKNACDQDAQVIAYLRSALTRSR
jgi:uncharacterized membrane protein YhiD involved in acid resistance